MYLLAHFCLMLQNRAGGILILLGTSSLGIVAVESYLCIHKKVYDQETCYNFG